MAKRFKLVNYVTNLYGTTNGTWALVDKVKTGFKLLHRPMACKDYIHEFLANSVHQKAIQTIGDFDYKSYTPSESLRFVMFFMLKDEILSKKYLYSVKKYINSIEKVCGVTQTSITEVDKGTDKDKGLRAFVVTCDKTYIESPALLHGLIAFLRTLYKVNCSVNYKNIKSVLESKDLYQDIGILRFITKHDVFKLLMANHSDIFKDLTLKDIYPLKVNNPSGSGYHSGFGMVALCTKCLASKAYAEKVNTVLKEHKIPTYK